MGTLPCGPEPAVFFGLEAGVVQEADSLDTRATIHQRLGHPDRASGYAGQTLTLARQAAYRLREGQILTTLAGIDLGLGEPEQARERAQRALDLHRDPPAR